MHVFDHLMMWFFFDLYRTCLEKYLRNRLKMTIRQVEGKYWKVKTIEKHHISKMMFEVLLVPTFQKMKFDRKQCFTSRSIWEVLLIIIIISISHFGVDWGRYVGPKNRQKQLLKQKRFWDECPGAYDISDKTRHPAARVVWYGIGPGAARVRRAWPFPINIRMRGRGTSGLKKKWWKDE